MEEQNVNAVETPTVEAPTSAGETQPSADATATTDISAQPEAKTEAETFGLSKEDYEKVTTDPVLSKYYKSMQAGFTKKTQELAEERKKTNQKKSLSEIISEIQSDAAYQEELKSLASQYQPQTAQPTVDPVQQNLNIKQAAAVWTKLNPQQQQDYFLNLDENSRVVLEHELQMQNFIRQQQIDSMRKEDETNIQTYGDAYKKTLPKINEFYLSGKKPSADMVYKALSYEDFGKSMYEKGKAEALQIRQNATNANLNNGRSGLNIPGGTFKSPKEAGLAALERMGIS